MKKKDKNDISKRAAECRREAESNCLDNNLFSEQMAVEEFECGEVATYFRDNAAYITGLVVQRLEQVQKGDPTLPLRPFDAETLVRLLSTDTRAEYSYEGYDENLSDEATIEAFENDTLICGECSMAADTPTTGLQDKLCHALEAYARQAAVYAKHIGSASLLDWAGIIDILMQRGDYGRKMIREESAIHLIELEKSAADRLRLDKIVFELPPFKNPSTTRKGR